MENFNETMESNKFEDLLTDKDILKAIYDMVYTEATPIQSQSIKFVKEGYDVIGQSQTGTGKTAAFGLPTLEKIDEDIKTVQSIILCPTRELAMQVAEEFRKFLKYRKDIKVLPIYGGQPIDRQIQSLKRGVQVVIGTPGRVIDHINRNTLKLNDVKTVILDEADEMLNMGFREDIEEILKSVPKERQTVLFSATMPKEILELTRQYQTEPKHIRIKKKELTVETIKQYYSVTKEALKFEALCRFIDQNNPDLAIVFCNTKKRVDEVVEELQKRNYFAEGLHGDLKQLQRDNVMKKFRNKTLQVLVATDVAARGIDVDDVDMVINFDLPQDYEYYVHRIGRTGRAGKSGTSYTFVTARETRRFEDILKFTKSSAEKITPPSAKDIAQAKKKEFITTIKENILLNNDTEMYQEIVDTLNHDGYTTEQVALALIYDKLFDSSIQDINFEEKPRSRDRDRDKEKGSNKKGSTSIEENMTRLFLNVGKRDRVDVRDIVGCIANETGIRSRHLGKIILFDEFTFVDVETEFSDKVVSTLKDVTLKNRTVSAEIAKVTTSRRERSDRGDRQYSDKKSKFGSNSNKDFKSKKTNGDKKGFSKMKFDDKSSDRRKFDDKGSDRRKFDDKGSDRKKFSKSKSYTDK
ncbi:MAG: DEAD/DEAH box helicase [Lachnospirales bacterium]